MTSTEIALRGITRKYPYICDWCDDNAAAFFNRATGRVACIECKHMIPAKLRRLIRFED